MTVHQHEWRNWPFSADVLCVECGYSIIDGMHYPRGKWLVPMPQVSGNPTECEHYAFIPDEGSFVCQDCGARFDGTAEDGQEV